MDLATLFVRFKADTSDVDKSVKGLEASTKSSAGNIAKTLAGAFGAAAIGAGIKKTIDSASDLNETVSKTRTIFGEASSAVEATAATAAKSMGLSKTAYLDAASGLKGLLDNLGLTRDESTKWSQDLTRLGSDLGSFFNKDPAQAIEAIQAALRGESEPIRAFNVQLSDAAVKAEAMKEGLYAGTGAIDAHAKAQATLALIMQQTTAAQGDFARTSDGVANSQRIAKAEMENTSASIGQALLPVYGKVVQLVGEAADAFGSLPGPVQTAVVALAGLVALSGPISSMIELAGGLSSALAAVGVSSTVALGALAGLAVVAAAVYLVLRDHDDRQAQVAAHSKEVAKALSSETDELVKQRQAAGEGATATQALADAQASLSKAIIDSDKHQARLTQSLGILGLQTTDTADLIGKLQTADQAYLDKVKGATPEIRARGDAQLALIATLLTSKGVSEEAAKAAVAEAGSMAAGKGGTIDFAAATKGLTDEQRLLVDALVNVGKSASLVDIAQASADYLNGQVAVSKYNAELVAQAEAEAGATRNSEDAGKVREAYQRILENLTPAQRAQTDATNAQTDATKTNTAATQDATDAVAEYAVRQDQAKAKATANASATSRLNDDLRDNSSRASAAAKAADALAKALDDVFGTNLDLEEANRNLAEGFDKVKQSIKDNGTTLDINSEKGRANRSAIEDQVKTIQEKIKADVASGVSIGDATAAGELYRQKLIETSGKTKEARAAAEAYIDQLGLTPENVETAVKLAHDDEVKQRLQGLLTQLGDIPADKATEIQADIDQGKFDEAEAALNKLARNRPVLFVPSGSFTSGNVAGPRSGKSALGRFVPGGSNFLTTVAEIKGRAGDEVILPLGDPARMRQLAAGNDVGSRILDALGSEQAEPAGATTPLAIASTPTSARGWRDFVLNNYRQDITLDDANRLLMLARLS